jgi:hypothetical protein
VSGPKVFHDVTERAAFGARFTPTLKEGKPTKLEFGSGPVAMRYEPRR